MTLSIDELQETIKTYNANDNSISKAAKQAGITTQTFAARLKVARARIPEGQQLKGISSLYDGDGTLKSQWVKTNVEANKQLDSFKNAIKALKKNIPQVKPKKSPKGSVKDLLSTYIITDYHLGCLAWEGETGEAWNTKHAENMLVDWFKKACDAAPDADTAILGQLGDFLHYDSLDAVTPSSGHPLDADARYQQVVEVGVRAVRRIVDILLDKHKKVHIIMAEGNHDIGSSVWLRMLFDTVYEKEPRVTVDNSHIPFYAYEWGNTSLFFHHGHKTRMAQVSSAMAGMFREIFGRTKYSYCHMGHLHHKDVKENHMMIVEQHPTLAAKDAYSTRGGYNSQRGASVITYSKEYGEVSRSIIRPEML